MRPHEKEEHRGKCMLQCWQFYKVQESSCSAMCTRLKRNSMAFRCLGASLVGGSRNSESEVRVGAENVLNFDSKLIKIL